MVNYLGSNIGMLNFNNSKIFSRNLSPTNNIFNLDSQFSLVRSKFLSSNNRTSNLFNRSVSNSLSDFRANLGSLKEEISKLSALKTSDDKVDYNAKSSNTNVIEALVDDASSSRSYEVVVNSIAKAQSNHSSKLVSSETNVFNSGSNAFSIKGSTSHVFSINIQSSDTNLDVLTKMRNEINNYNSQFKASIISDGNSSSLRVYSALTGSLNSFKVEDLNSFLINRLGINKNIVESANNSSFTIDDKDYDSQSNSFEHEGLKLSLKDSGSANISVSLSSIDVLSHFKPFVDSFNKAFDFLSRNRNISGFNSIRQELENILSTYDSDLSSIGLSFSNLQGKLAFDQNAKSSDQQALDSIESYMKNNKDLFNKMTELIDDSLSKPGINFVDFSLPASQRPINNYFRDTSNSMLYTLGIASTGLILDYLL